MSMVTGQAQVLALGREVQRMKGFISNLEFKMVRVAFRAFTGVGTQQFFPPFFSFFFFFFKEN